MKTREHLILFALGLAAVGSAAFFQSAPGYMDADYYYAGALRLAQGHGFSEMILWNYLDDPRGLPHPSHAYWMPLTSLVAFVGLKLAGGGANFWAGRLGFLLLGALAPVLTAALSWQLNERRAAAIFSGLLAVFPAFYLPYLPTSDAFGIYMLLGAAFFLLLGGARWRGAQQPVGWRAWLPAGGLGLIAGLMHLARADGVIWLGTAIFAVLWGGRSAQGGRRRLWLELCAVFAGYLLVMGPWMGRNWLAFGTLLSPGGARALWMTDYDELFIYPASLLTMERWQQTGLGAILQARGWALGQNLQTTLAVQMEIFLLPLALVGAWGRRSDLRVQSGAAGWLLTFGMMTLVFPLAGARGGWFHSGAALQPLTWALAPLGLEICLAWGQRRRGWRTAQARPIFQTGLLLLAVFMTAFVFFQRVVGERWEQPAWNDGARLYSQLAAQIGPSVQPGEVVLVNNAPGYFLASGQAAISIPYGDVQTLRDVAERYGGRYLLLEFNQLQGDDDLYAQPGDRPGLHYVGTVEEVRIYEFLAVGAP